MRAFGLYASVVEEARDALRSGTSLDDAIAAMYRKPTGAADGLALALLHTADPGGYAESLAEALDASVGDVAAALGRVRRRSGEADFLLTGAEATALLLADTGAQVVFAYPGTSELAVCDAVARVPTTRLVNARGDKEAAFMSAGASMLAPGKGAAILHGARGLTNAAGGIADARRNECASIAIVGLPSTSSAKYLPPHGEPGLLDGIGRFAKSWYELRRVDGEAGVREFFATFAAAAADVAARPHGPVLVGLPQDVAQAAWLPYSALAGARSALTAAARPALPDVAPAVEAIAASERVVVLVDDYLLRYPDASEALASFCSRVGGIALQVRYQRGPMLFDRVDPREVPAFAGWLDPSDGEQQKLLGEADLLVTLEDRNMYQRVVGGLPPCRKVAINSDGAKVRKNEYLAAGDVLLEGEVTAMLRAITDRLPAPREAWVDAATVRNSSGAPRAEVPSAEARRLRDSVGTAFAEALATAEAPVLVDDAQMFGGLLAESHDRFPQSLRIFGGHGGFVGGGIASATGLALGEPEASVVCSLGDQAFGNGCQGLIAAVEQRAPVTFVVCNNGGSVSLLKQARAARERLFDDGAEPFLVNSPVEPTALAEAVGLSVESIDLTVRDDDALAAAGAHVETALVKALAARAPHLIELRLPSDADAWAGIWITGGFDEATRGADGGAGERR